MSNEDTMYDPKYQLNYISQTDIKHTFPYPEIVLQIYLTYILQKL